MKLDLKGALAAANAAREAIRGNVVPPEEVLRRASICYGPVQLEKEITIKGRRFKAGKYPECPFKLPVEGLDSKISAYLGKLSAKNGVSEEVSEKMCGICGCGFTLLLPTVNERLHKDSSEQRRQRPKNCWILPENRK